MENQVKQAFLKTKCDYQGPSLFLVMILNKYVLIGTIIRSPHILPKKSKINSLLADVDGAKYLPIVLFFPLAYLFHTFMSDFIPNNPRKSHLYQARRAEYLNHPSTEEEITLKRRM